MKTRLFPILFTTCSCLFIGCDEKSVTPKISTALEVYPNPAIDLAMITVQNNVTTSYELEVYDIKGKIMMKQNILPGSQDVRIELKGKPKGRYQVILITDKETLTQQLIKI